MNTREVQQALAEIGFGKMIGKVDGVPGPLFYEAVKWFQRGYCPEKLLVDGFPGKRTQRALEWSVNRGGLASRHFKFKEFASKGNGHIHVKRQLIRGLEKLRRITGSITVHSGYRDPYYNDVTVGAVPNSQHKYGNALDPIFNEKTPTVNQVRELEIFSGIGYKEVNGILVPKHLDVRHTGPNTTGGTPKKPSMWRYA